MQKNLLQVFLVPLASVVDKRFHYISTNSQVFLKRMDS